VGPVLGEVHPGAGRKSRSESVSDRHAPQSNFQSDEQVNLLRDRSTTTSSRSRRTTRTTTSGTTITSCTSVRRSSEHPIPINNVKIYGGDIGRWTTSVEEGTRRFWRNVFGGCASSRFHRPGPSHHFFAIGLSELAQTHIRSMRADRRDERLRLRAAQRIAERASRNEAYCLAQPGSSTPSTFPDGGQVKLDVSAARGTLEVRWLDIANSRWQQASATARRKQPTRKQCKGLAIMSALRTVLTTA
jgi:hypothetical protein